MNNSVDLLGNPTNMQEVSPSQKNDVGITKPNGIDMGSACLSQSSIEIETMAKSGGIPEYPTAEELVSKARAPVKREYVREAHPVRPLNPKDEGGLGAKVSMEKKSKNQLRKERQQERKSVQNICLSVARAGDIKACPYGPNCHLSHDLEGFMAQKPPDLPGKCPFLNKPDGCQYGVACCFAGSHKEHDSLKLETVQSEIGYEMNGLEKGLQKLMWKSAVTFPKADEQLKS